MELAAHEVGPERFPEAKDVGPLKFALVPNEQHAEEEEKVSRVSRLKVKVEGRVHQLDEMVESEELCTHARLIAEEIALLLVVSD